MPQKYRRLTVLSQAEAFTTTLWLSIYFGVVVALAPNHLAVMVALHPGHQTRPAEQDRDGHKYTIAGIAILDPPRASITVLARPDLAWLLFRRAHPLSGRAHLRSENGRPTRRHETATC